jgi:hypothetical protein
LQSLTGEVPAFPDRLNPGSSSFALNAESEKHPKLSDFGQWTPKFLKSEILSAICQFGWELARNRFQKSYTAHRLSFFEKQKL